MKFKFITKLLRQLQTFVRRIFKFNKSYHDVVIIVNGKRYKLFNSSYGYRLMCTRAGGWELWHIWDGEERLIGGEYNNDNLIIEVAGKIICG